MKKNKFIICVIFTCIISLFLIGCNSSQPNPPASAPSVEPASNNVSQTTKAPEKSEEVTNIVTEAVVPVSSKVTVAEKVVYEENGVRITLKSLDMDGMLGPELKFLVENDSDKSIIVQANEVSVNGYMVSTTMSTEVQKGKKANDELRFLQSKLEMSGITTFADIELRFHFINSDDWTDYYDSELIKIETSAAEGFEYTYDESGSSMYTSDGLDVIFKGMSADASIYGPSMVIYLHNFCDQNLMVQARDVSVNGFMTKVSFSCELPKGKHAIDTIAFLSSDLEANGITQFDNIELSLHIIDKDTWKPIVDTEPIKLTFHR